MWLQKWQTNVVLSISIHQLSIVRMRIDLGPEPLLYWCSYALISGYNSVTAFVTTLVSGSLSSEVTMLRTQETTVNDGTEANKFPERSLWKRDGGVILNALFWFILYNRFLDKFGL